MSVNANESRKTEEEDNILLGSRKGIYRSTGNLFMTNRETIDNYGNTVLLPKLDLVKGFMRLAMMTKFGTMLKSGDVKDMELFQNADLSELDYENVKRSMREMTFILITFIGYSIVKALGDDDEDKDSALAKTRNGIFNTLMRSNRDLTTYLSPDSLQSIIKNIIPAISTASGFMKIADATLDTVMFDPYSNPDTENEYLKLPRRIEEMIPMVNQIRKTYNKFDKEQKLTNNY